MYSWGGGGGGVVALVSSNSSGEAGNFTSGGDNFGGDVSITADARYIAFGSYASNLVPGDNTGGDIFLKDILTGSISRLAEHAMSPHLSADGRFLLYETTAASPVYKKIYLMDLSTNVSKTVIGTGSTLSNCSMSADGRFVAYAHSPIPYPSERYQIYVKDMNTGVDSLVSHDELGQTANSNSHSPVISADGRYVVFESTASNLVPGDTNNVTDVFLRDMQSGNISRVSTGLSAAEANGESSRPAISADGRLIVFDSFATNIVTDDTNNARDVFAKDMITGGMDRISTNAQGGQAGSDSYISFAPAMSLDGRYIAFYSSFSDLVPGDTGNYDLFLKDTSTNDIKLLSTGINGKAIGDTGGLGKGNISVSREGNYVVFTSRARNLPPDGASTNTDNFQQIYLASTDSTFANPAPTGWIATTSPNVSMSLQDPGANIDTASEAVYLDGQSMTGCVKSNSGINCQAASLADGQHHFTTIIYDATGMPHFGFGNFKVDVTPPEFIALPKPSGWSNAQTIEADFRDLGSGINVSSASVSIDGGPPLTSCSTNTTHLQCGFNALPEGSHNYSISISDVLGNTSTTTGLFNVDRTKPTCINTGPVGEIATPAYQVRADVADSGSGIDYSTLSLKINGAIKQPVVDMASGHINFNGTGYGTQIVHLEVKDKTGNLQTADWSFSVPPGYLDPDHTYYFTWYDSLPENGMNGNWIMICNKGSQIEDVDVFIAGELQGSYRLKPDQEVTPAYPRKMNGPVAVVSRSGQPLMVSQRVLYGSTINEVLAVRGSDLDSSYYFTWYDNRPANGMNGNWILVGNPGFEAADVDIYIKGQLKDRFTIAPGQEITPVYPGLMDGPVKIVSTNGQKLICSQRVLYRNSFNEVMGIAQSRLERKYWFSWYDDIPDHGMNGNWILVGSADENASTHVQFCIGSQCYPQPSAADSRSYKDIPVNETGYLRFPGLMAPNICVTSLPWFASVNLNIFASQRVLYKNSFNELLGMPDSNLSSSYSFPWYDQKTPGMQTWILVINKGYASDGLSICIQNQCESLIDESGAVLSIQPGEVLLLQSPGLMGGPIRVSSISGQKLMASERVTYFDGFEELQGVTYRDTGNIPIMLAKLPESGSFQTSLDVIATPSSSPASKWTVTKLDSSHSGKAPIIVSP